MFSTKIQVCKDVNSLQEEKTSILTEEMTIQCWSQQLVRTFWFGQKSTLPGWFNMSWFGQIKKIHIIL